MKVSPAQTYHKIQKSEPDFEDIRQRLKVKSLEAKENLAKKFPHVQKFLSESGVFLDEMRSRSSKLMATGALTSALFFSPPIMVNTLPTASELLEKFKVGEKVDDLVGNNKLLIDYLGSVLPDKPKVLTVGEEKALEQGILELTKIPVKASLEGEHLNVNYGYIGAEQHLFRFPGDTLSQHGSPEIQKEGIAPGLGAWGYFAFSRREMTANLYETEKWYGVVQTLYLPDWNTRQPYLRDWYRYRKILIVNTVNGNAVVAAVADSGPAAWTGKHFGGSPEVMEYLGGARYKKGPVLVLFVDDPQNQIPLGPVEYGKVSEVLSSKI
jgi:hypothetical protein